MKGGELIREARLRASLSQEALARKIGTRQPVIARWESGSRSPSFENVTRAIRACGLDLTVDLSFYDQDHDLLIGDTSKLSPQERLDHMLAGRANVLRWRGAAKSVGR